MKNVMLYLKMDDTPYKAHDSIMNYLYAQIDNSLHYGWHIDDIIVVSNFEFEYRGVTNTQLRVQCEYNVWANKFYAIRQLIEDGINDNLWLHDYDVWQIDQFEFPKFNGMMAGCPYDLDHPNWNGGSFFFSKNSYSLVQYICDFYEINKDIVSRYDDGRGSKWYSDEIIIGQLRVIPDIQHLFSSLTPQYNLGITHFNSRYDYATKPIKAIHVKLLDVACQDKFNVLSKDLNLIPDNLQKTIKKYA